MRLWATGHVPRHPGRYVLCGGLGCVSVWSVGGCLLVGVFCCVCKLFWGLVNGPRPVATLGLPTVVLDAGSASR